MINYIFGTFIILGILYGFFTGGASEINTCLIVTGKQAIELIFNMIPLLCLWLGVAQIATASGLISKISKFMAKILRSIFPELKKDSLALGYIATSIVMNFFGLGNAATPFGLKAFEEMQKENVNKSVATRSMITFLVITTSSVTLIPTTIISLRTLHSSKNPTSILPACIITSFLSCTIGLAIDRICVTFFIKE